MSDARGRGFSLLEVLLAAVLGLMLLILLMRVFVPMSKGLVRGTDQSALQQTAAIALDRIHRALVRTPPQAATVGNTGRALAVHPLASVTAAGRQVFEDKLTVFWLDPAGRRLYERQVALTGTLPPRFATRPTQPQLAAYAVPVSDQRVLATEVETFTVSVVGETVTVELVLARKAPDGGVPERFELRRTYLLRNETT